MKNDQKDDISDLGEGRLTPYRIFLALLSGFLLIVSFPKFGLGFMSWVAFVPLFIALRGAPSLKQGFLLGFLTGLMAYVGIIYWIVFVVVNYGHLPIYLGVLLMLLLSAYLSVYVGLFGAGVVYFKDKVPLFLSAPVMWVGLEYIKSNLITGFPWENLGYSQYNNLAMIQIADIAGVFLLSFLIILINVAIYQIMTRRDKRALALAFCVVLIWACVYAYGIIRIKQVDDVMKASPSLNVTLVQGNIDQSLKWQPDRQQETVNRYETLSRTHAPDPPGLIVWPETAAPFIFQDEQDFHFRLRSIPEQTGSFLLFGAMSYAPRGQTTDYFNSAYLLSPAGEIAGRYDKVHLVPYGEYVPLRNVFPFIRALTAGIGDFASGSGYDTLMMGDHPIGVLICYEGILPHAVRQYKKLNAKLLVNITNDAWFGDSSAPYQHFSMSVFRAVESRLYLVRAANTGISAIVDPKGRVQDRTNLFEATALSGSVKLMDQPTLYAKLGDWWVGLCYLIFVIMLVWSILRRVKHVRR